MDSPLLAELWNNIHCTELRRSKIIWQEAILASILTPNYRVSGNRVARGLHMPCVEWNKPFL